MRATRLAALLAAALAGLAQAAPLLTLSSQPAHALDVLEPAELPLRLVAGAEGGTVIGANATSARSTVTGGTITDATANASTAKNQWTSGLRVRMVLVSATGAVAECVRCEVQLRCGATTSTQLAAVSGAVTQQEGPWLEVDASGGACAWWHAWGVARATVVADQNAVFDYRLEMTPAGKTSPVAAYTGMRLTFVV